VFQNPISTYAAPVRSANIAPQPGSLNYGTKVWNGFGMVLKWFEERLKKGLKRVCEDRD
jgi:hypothetical protein